MKLIPQFRANAKTNKITAAWESLDAKYGIEAKIATEDRYRDLGIRVYGVAALFDRLAQHAAENGDAEVAARCRYVERALVKVYFARNPPIREGYSLRHQTTAETPVATLVKFETDISLASRVLGWIACETTDGETRQTMETAHALLSEVMVSAQVWTRPNALPCDA